MEEPTQQSLSLLKAGLSEAQATVRSYDTKAQIVGVGYIFSLNVISNVDDRVVTDPHISTALILFFWGIMMLPILLFGFVLYPSRKAAPELADGTDKRSGGVLYIDASRRHSIKELKESAAQCDPESEIAYELLKVSRLREKKRQRFLRALFASGFCFGLLFIDHLIRTF